MVDILLATYNGESFLKELLESIVAQSYTDWRLIVCDDLSSDKTLQILEDFSQNFEPGRVIIEKNSSGIAKGATKNFIDLIKKSSAKYMMCCDQDDVWHSDKIEKSMNEMLRLEKIYGNDVPLMIHTDLNVVDKDLNLVSPSLQRYMNLRTENALNYELIQNNITGCTTLFNQKLKFYIDMLENTEKIIMYDHCLALICMIFGYTKYVDIPTVDYRQHGKNTLGALNTKNFSYMFTKLRDGNNNFRKEMLDSYKQAEYLLEVYGQYIKDKSKFNLIKKYSELYKYGKFKRLFYIFKNSYLKKGLNRKLIQLLWG